MKNKNVIVEFFKYFTRSENRSQLIPIFLISAVFLFMPVSLFAKIGIVTSLELIKLIALVMFVFSSFYILYWGIESAYKNYKHRRAKNKYNEKIDKLISDHNANRILRNLYREHPHPARLDISNQKVRLLEEYRLITQAASPNLLPTSTYQAGKRRDGLSMNYSLTEFGENKIKEKMTKEES